VPELAHMAFARSPHASARIVSIDTAAAAAHDDVVAVLTHRDFPDLDPWLPALNRPEYVATELVLLAREQVRHVGEAVAMVVAETPHAAEDAAELVRVDYDVTDTVTSLAAALEPGAPRVHEHGNVLLDVQFADDAALEDAFARAAVVVDGEFETGRVCALPLEGRACLARWDVGEQRMLLYTSTQIPHIVRTTVAGLLKLPERRMRVIAPDVGGGFGQKCVDEARRSRPALRPQAHADFMTCFLMDPPRSSWRGERCSSISAVTSPATRSSRSRIPR
jgi:aerobic carbon-monoxide dehydrogenase large subunit